MNIRQELKSSRDHWKKIENAHRKMEESSTSNGIAMGVAECVRDLDALLQRIPDGWELRPRISLPVITPNIQLDLAETDLIFERHGIPEWSQDAVDFVAILQRAMLDAASEEKGDE